MNTEINDLFNAIKEKRAITVSGTGLTSVFNQMFKISSAKMPLLGLVRTFYGDNALTNIPVWSPTVAVPENYDEGATTVLADTLARLGTTSISPKTYTSLIPVSNEALLTSSVNLQEQLLPVFAEAFNKAIHTGILTGSGEDNEMTGLFTEDVIPNAVYCDNAGLPDMEDLRRLALTLRDYADDAVIVMNPTVYSGVMTDTTDGSKETSTFSVLTALTHPGDIEVCDATIDIAITDDTPAKVATKIGNATYADWTITDVSDEVITFTAKVAGATSPITFDDVDETGVDGTIAIITPGTDGTYETAYFDVTAGVTTPGNITVAGVAVAISAAETTPALVATAIETAFAANADWTVVADEETVTFTAKTLGDKTNVSFTDTDITGVSIGMIYTTDGSSDVAEVATLTITSAPTLTKNITVDGVSVAILMTDDAADIAAKIAAKSYTNWTASANSATLVFTGKTDENLGAIVLNAGDTGITFSEQIIVNGRNDILPGIDVYRQELLLNKTIEGVKVILTSYAPTTLTTGSVIAVGGKFSDYAVALASSISIEPLRIVGNNVTYFQANYYFNGKPIVSNNFYALKTV